MNKITSMFTKRSPERVEVEGGFIYNAFPTLTLSKRHKVIVPTLELGTEDARKRKTPLFAFDVENADGLSRQVRITAECIAVECGRDRRTDALDTDFFSPRKGLDLNKGRLLPSVMVHEFGLVGLAFVEELFDDARATNGVGIITRI